MGLYNNCFKQTTMGPYKNKEDLTITAPKIAARPYNNGSKHNRNNNCAKTKTSP